LTAVRTELEHVRSEEKHLRSLADHRATELSLEIDQLQTKADQLNKILSSRGWHALKIYYGIRNQLQLRIASLSTTLAVLVDCFIHPKFGWQELLAIRSIIRVEQSGIFDSAWYISQYPDVLRSGMNPLVHYVLFGAHESRNPSAWFDTAWYLSNNPDVKRSGIPALDHYIVHGAHEGRNPSPRFDSRWYLTQNVDVNDAALNPLAHFIQCGMLEGRQPLPPLAELNRVEWQQREYSLTEAGLDSTHDVSLTSGCEGSATTAPLTNESLWDEYQALSSRITLIKREAIQSFSPIRPQLFQASEDLAAFAKTIQLSPGKSPLVSIIIPVHNQLKYTLECLASISHSTNDVNYEVIIVDDSSTDQTAELLPTIPNLIYFRNETNRGFIETCNSGASKARGAYVVFLNNDTQVMDGWLRGLLEIFKTYDMVGAVGPKVVYPDGRLQEAGVVVNYDCSSTLVGLFEDPAMNRFNRIREVMYVSGVCMLLPTTIFHGVGGFSTQVAPAYCEDCDISFRLRKLGLRIIYNPNSLVVHHLSISTTHSNKIAAVTRNQQRLSELWQPEIDKLNEIKAIAFYLPQYHPIVENDRWWGKGFTEWSNVAKAKPNYVGHDQPRLPADLGFYDLRLTDVKNAQISLARRYGINGFCYYYYWFAGRRLLERPLERVLSGVEDSMPFCLAWANENWTRRWDGNDSQILIGQKHSAEDDKAVFYDLMRFFRHPDYLRIDGRPLLLIYRTSLFPDIRRTTDLWRQISVQEGCGEPYLALIESFEHVGATLNPKNLGFDASVEFPPHGMGVEMALTARLLNSAFRGTICDYEEVALKYIKQPNPGHVRFRTVMPRWDNTPRRQNDPVIFENATPGAYQAWLEAIIEQTHHQNYGDERLLFINAWNEWAEGNYLEPDLRYGHAYLEATQYALTRARYQATPIS